jgi:hypothetical protein
MENPMLRPLTSRLLVSGFTFLAFMNTHCGSGGSDGGGPAPRFVVASHGTAEFDSSGTDIEDVCPHELDFSIFLEVGGQGWVSLEHPAFGSEVFAVTWTESAGRYDVVAPEILVAGEFAEDPYYWAEVGWEDLAFTVTDEDGDGTAETGTATATLLCEWEIVLSYQLETHDSTFELHGEVTPARLEFSGVDGTEPLYPFDDTMKVVSSKAILAESIPGGAQLLVGGEPFAATITATGVAHPFAKGFTIDPIEAIPFGAVLTLDPGSIVDGFGVPATYEGLGYKVMDDPGPVTSNPSFEVSGGWIGLTAINVDDPVDGVKAAIVSYRYPRGRELIGYLDVPEDATTLSVAVSVEEYLEGCDHVGSRFRLYTSRGSQTLRPTSDDPDCNDYPEGCTIPWTRMSADLSLVRGERVVLRATPATSTACRPDFYDVLLIDDVRIE